MGDANYNHAVGCVQFAADGDGCGAGWQAQAGGSSAGCVAAEQHAPQQQVYRGPVLRIASYNARSPVNCAIGCGQLQWGGRAQGLQWEQRGASAGILQELSGLLYGSCIGHNRSVQGTAERGSYGCVVFGRHLQHIY